MSTNYEKLLESVSRTFAISINQLPTKIKESITLAYMLLRVSDILEDNEVMEAEQKVALLKHWSKILQNQVDCQSLVNELSILDNQDPEVIVALRSQELIDYLHTFPEEIQEIIVRHVSDTTLGMARWQLSDCFVKTEEEMEDYMHQVAGRVGYLITEVFAFYTPKIGKLKDKLMPLSREFGLALQTVNIIRGMKKDYERGWVFTPKAYFDEVGLTKESFFSMENEQKSKKLISLLVRKAEKHLRLGLDFVLELPKSHHRIRLACMWPLFFAVKTLAISNNNLEVIRDEVKITRDQVMEILSLTTLKGYSNKWIKKYYYNILEQAQLEYSLID